MFKKGDMVLAPRNNLLARAKFYWDLGEEGPYKVLSIGEDTIKLCASLSGLRQCVPKKFVEPQPIELDLDRFL